MAWTAPSTWVSGAILTAAQLNQQLRDNMLELAPFMASWTTYTPQLRTGTTNRTSTVNYGRYLKVGKLVIVQASVTATTGGGASEVLKLGLPSTLNPVNASPDNIIGAFQVKDAGTAYYVGTACIVETGYVSGTGYGANNNMGANAPAMTMATNDVISFEVQYEIA